MVVEQKFVAKPTKVVAKPKLKPAHAKPDNPPPPALLKRKLATTECTGPPRKARKQVVGGTHTASASSQKLQEALGMVIFAKQTYFASMSR